MKNILLYGQRLCAGFVIVILFSGGSFAERLSVSVDSAIVRTGPGTTYDIAWENLDKNYPLQVLDQKDGWYYIRDYEDDVGWIYKSNVTSFDSVITKKGGCNVRSGPGTKFDVVFVVDDGVPFKVMKRQGQWINIQHADGDSGWIHEALVW